MLQRFHSAQAGAGGYATALSEMRRGRKQSHWIWFIFPQLDGLGRSSTAQKYALRDLANACEYLRDPVLGPRYCEITDVVAEQLASGVRVDDLMGGETDALKLASSITLFRAAAFRLAASETEGSFAQLAALCDLVLQRLAAHGYEACGFTIAQCAEFAAAGLNG